MTKKEFDKAVAEYRSMKALVKEAQDNLDAIAKSMKEYLKEQDVDSVIGNDYKVSLTTVHRTNWDSDKLKSLLGDLVPEYQKPCSYPQLRVS